MGRDDTGVGHHAPGLQQGLAARVADSVREVTKLRAEVTLCAPGSLPNDGKVIADVRRYE